jgi:hypothetical protein
LTKAEERAFEIKAEKMLAGQRELPPGRDFRCFVFRFRNEDKNFEKRYHKTFPGSPGSPEWWERKFAKCQN